MKHIEFIVIIKYLPNAEIITFPHTEMFTLFQSLFEDLISQIYIIVKEQLEKLLYETKNLCEYLKRHLLSNF